MKDLFRILIAPLIWFAAFCAVYGLHGVICGTGLSGVMFGLPLARVMLVAAYGGAIAVQALLLLVLYRHSDASPLVRFVSRATGWVGLVATIWSLFPVVVTSYYVP